MKTKTLVGLTAAGAAVVTLTAFSSLAEQTAPAAKADETYTGTVLSVDPNGRTLEVKEFLFSKRFDLGSQCAYVMWNKPAGTLNDLRAGEKVTVSYQNANGVLVADRVEQDPMREAGIVQAADPAAGTLTLHSGWTYKTFQVPANCQVMLRKNKIGSLASLEPGYYVTVTYELPQDKPIAREIAQTGATFTGKLTALDMANRTVKAKSLFDTKQFRLADNCAIVINGKASGQLGDLKLGEELLFSYNDVNGIDVVNSIVNEPATQHSQTTSVQPRSYPGWYSVP
jgi:hypothetical protein